MSKATKKNRGKRVTQARKSTRNINDIKIIGENVLVTNGLITAYYLIPLSNYSTTSSDGIINNIDELYNLIQNLAAEDPTVKFTIERIHKTVKADDVRKNLIETARLYKPEYEMPELFSTHIVDDEQTYCLLGVVINLNNSIDVTENTILETAKELIKNAVNKISLGTTVDPDRVAAAELKIYNSIRDKVVRASKELVFYTFVSKMYPGYDISYDKLSFINENNYEAIMGSITQTVIDNFDWFELQNEGLSIFDIDEYEPTYGCMFNVYSFPAYINETTFTFYDDTFDEIFNSTESGCVYVTTSIECLKKDTAKTKFKRTRAADRFERNQAWESGAESENVEKLQDNIDLATKAITDIEDGGDTICQFNTSILVITSDKANLRKLMASIMTLCKDKNVLLSKSLTQATDFINHFVFNKPQHYVHLTSIRFPLSFNFNSGATVGDVITSTNSLWQPQIGEDA